MEATLILLKLKKLDIVYWNIVFSGVWHRSVSPYWAIHYRLRWSLNGILPQSEEFDLQCTFRYFFRDRVDRSSRMRSHTGNLPQCHPHHSLDSQCHPALTSGQSPSTSHQPAVTSGSASNLWGNRFRLAGGNKRRVWVSVLELVLVLGGWFLSCCLMFDHNWPTSLLSYSEPVLTSGHLVVAPGHSVNTVWDMFQWNWPVCVKKILKKLPLWKLIEKYLDQRNI